MTLRLATSDDAAAIAAVYRLSAWHPHIHTPEEDIAFFRDRMLAEQTVWVIEGEGGLIGYLGGVPGWVNHLFVHPDHQGAGYGSRLLKRAMEGSEIVQLWTFQGNTKARAFYEAKGFVAVEFTDGARNEEKLPDVRYEWRR